jgi:hypothetical protein
MGAAFGEGSEEKKGTNGATSHNVFSREFSENIFKYLVREMIYNTHFSSCAALPDLNDMLIQSWEVDGSKGSEK